MEWKQTITKEFWNDFSILPPDVTQRAKHAISRMLEDPWALELHPEKVKSAEPGIHSARVDDKYRIIWKHIKPNDILFCIVDKHDEAYRRAARKSFTLKNGMIQIADITKVGGKKAETALEPMMRGIDKQIGALFVGYSDKELLDFGVSLDIMPHVRALEDVNQLPNIERLLSDTTYNKLIEIALGLIERPVVKDEELNRSLIRYQGGDELHRFVNSEEFKRALMGDMQEWMLFLAAPQRYLVSRPFKGPVRVRGVAGSGKTVIAIHRAYHLARQALSQNKRVLFLTYGNRLPGIISFLLNQLAGENAPELQAIECRSMHSWCYQFLSEHGYAPQVDDELVKDALNQAIQETKQCYPNLRVMNQANSYFVDEIKFVLKGKAISSLDDYLSLERSGRGTGLQPEERRAVFEIFQRYNQKLEAQGCCDYDDFILKSLSLILDDQWKSPYLAAIVDEIQDLSEATLRLIRAIIPVGPNDLFLVGDGLQRIYAGGVIMNRIQIEVTGRSALLRRNYRNTQQILRVAHAMMNGISFDDLEDHPIEETEPEYSLRGGETPTLRGFSTPENEIHWIGEEIHRLREEKGYRENDVAILYRFNKPYQDLIIKKLIDLQPTKIERDPTTFFGPGLKHTTFHSAKGLEFKVVFIVGVTDGQMVPKDDWSLADEALEDYYARERRLLYVAMTRARDVLYLTYARGGASRFLAPIRSEYLRR